VKAGQVSKSAPPAKKPVGKANPKKTKSKRGKGKAAKDGEEE